MCGIAGFTAPGPDADRIVRAMIGAMPYRGPDQTGFHTDHHIAVGHSRLTIIDPVGGRQPRHDPESNDLLVFNGEIYGYRHLAEDLRQQGESLRDQSDTEVLFALIRRYGVLAAIERIDGMFAFAFREGRTGRLWLARDRFGEKPLHYAYGQSGLAFASEIKALLQHPHWRNAALDHGALGRFLFFDYLPGGDTGLADLRKLPAGHALEYDGSNVRLHRYWQPVIGEHGTKIRPSRSQAVERLDQLLNQSIRDRLVADVPVGVFLSGGIDSSLVAALAGRLAPGITAYSVRFGSATYDETPFAAEVARHAGLRHEIVELNDADTLAAWRAVDEQLDEPFADASLVPTYLVCKAARSGVTVAMGGDGADELFAGYPNFKAARFSGLTAVMPEALGRMSRAMIDLLPGSEGYMSPPFLLRQLSHGFGLSPDRQCFAWMSSFAPDDIEALAAPDFVSAFAPLSAYGLIDAIGSEIPNRHPVERTSALFLGTYLPEDILTKVDRASMYNSLEVRAPFLARAFAEYALSLPPEMKLEGMKTKAVLKDLAARYLPASILARRKHGFALPLAELLRGPLRETVRDELLSATNDIAPMFRREGLQRLLDEHFARRRDHRKRIWTLFQLFRFADNLRRFRQPVLP